jgi:hypothetical protein
VVVIVLLVLTDDHPLIPGAALEAVNDVRGRAHSGGDGGGGQGLRSGGRWGIGRGARSTNSVECGSLGRARHGCRGVFGLVLASGAFAQRGPVGRGQVQGRSKVAIFFLELLDALLKCLF